MNADGTNQVNLIILPDTILPQTGGDAINC